MIYLVNDHGGYRHKEHVKAWLKARGVEFKDMGAPSEERVDAVDYIIPAIRDFKKNKGEYLIMICRSGAAMCMIANRFKGVRAVVCTDKRIAFMAKQHNNVNAVCFGADYIGKQAMMQRIELILNTPYLGGRYEERNAKIDQTDFNA